MAPRTSASVQSVAPNRCDRRPDISGATDHVLALRRTGNRAKWRARMDCLKNIVVGVDFSYFSRCALKQAARIAGWSQAKMHAVHVVDTSMVNHLKEFWGCSRALIRSSLALIESTISSVLAPG